MARAKIMHGARAAAVRRGWCLHGCGSWMELQPGAGRGSRHSWPGRQRAWGHADAAWSRQHGHCVCGAYCVCGAHCVCALGRPTRAFVSGNLSDLPLRPGTGCERTPVAAGHPTVIEKQHRGHPHL